MISDEKYVSYYVEYMSIIGTKFIPFHMSIFSHSDCLSTKIDLKQKPQYIVLGMCLSFPGVEKPCFRDPCFQKTLYCSFKPP